MEDAIPQMFGALIALYIPVWIALIRKLARRVLVPLFAVNTVIAFAYMLAQMNGIDTWFGIVVRLLWLLLLPVAFWRVRA